MSEVSGSNGRLLTFTQLVERIVELLLLEIEQRPQRFLIDLGLVFCFLYVMSSKSYKIPKQTKLTTEEVNELLDDWTPEPLISKQKKKKQAASQKWNVVSSAAQGSFTIEGKSKAVHNFATNNFLGLAGDKEIIAECKKTISKYGVGSCGPRGFYGTIDVHLNLESKLAKWLGTSDAIVYSYGFCTISSSIPAFSKRGDVIIYDDGVNFATYQGIELSRSSIQSFKHNDMNELERLLKEIVAKDKGRPVKNRRFIVINGVYENYGDLAPLRRIVELKNKYKFRLIMDDSYGIGVLGKNGRGSVEHWGVDVNEIEILTGNIENAFAAVGGFCTGSPQVVDHQRLAGLGYCFSASLPPYISTATIEAVRRIQENPQIVQSVAKNIRLMYEKFSESLPQCLRLDGSLQAPVMHIRYKGTTDQEEILTKFKCIVTKALDENIAVVCPTYTEKEKNPPPPSIRLSLSAVHTEEEINQCVNVLTRLLREEFGSE